ncbi:hypothetical protein BBM0305_04150 [Bifidobacterium breve MCC 0305]|nr:hypothetical protein BBM0305_04150 [Bifidobacterium breve MCC 0305]KOA61533.1 hypothetical protein BBM1604_04725 [Bifidobacterium breve MCC 1604]
MCTNAYEITLMNYLISFIAMLKKIVQIIFIL